MHTTTKDEKDDCFFVFLPVLSMSTAGLYDHFLNLFQTLFSDRIFAVIEFLPTLS